MPLAGYAGATPSGNRYRRAVTELTWAYSRDRLRSGLSYPVGQTQIMRGLRDAGTETNVSLSCPGRDVWQDSQSGPLVVASWYPNMGGNVFVKRGTPPRTRTWLTVYAVPSNLKASMAAILTDWLLPEACTWIKYAGERPDSAWAGSNHRWSVWLRGGKLTIEQN